jgi:hypothetical protein
MRNDGLAEVRQVKIIKVPILRLSPEWEPFFEIASIS